MAEHAFPHPGIYRTHRTDSGDHNQRQQKGRNPSNHGSRPLLELTTRELRTSRLLPAGRFASRIACRSGLREWRPPPQSQRNREATAPLTVEAPALLDGVPARLLQRGHLLCRHCAFLAIAGDRPPMRGIEGSRLRTLVMGGAHARTGARSSSCAAATAWIQPRSALSLVARDATAGPLRLARRPVVSDRAERAHARAAG